jgi:hypothetical protein
MAGSADKKKRLGDLLVQEGFLIKNNWIRPLMFNGRKAVGWAISW